MSTSASQDHVAVLNNLRLHYVDWGGTGPTLLLLTGFGDSARMFDGFAPQFTDRFHVLGLTRRGHPGSDMPPTGYDADTLTEDIRQFLDYLGIQQVILAGHSLAGVELTNFATKYPARTLALVYLDSAFDYARLPQIMEQDPSKNVPIPLSEKQIHESVEAYFAFLRMSHPDIDAIWPGAFEVDIRRQIAIDADGTVKDRIPPDLATRILADVSANQPDYTGITVPALAITAFPPPPVPVYFSPEQRRMFEIYWNDLFLPWIRQSLEQFRRGVSHGKILELPNTYHYCYLHRQREVVDAVRSFLLEALPQ